VKSPTTRPSSAPISSPDSAATSGQAQVLQVMRDFRVNLFCSGHMAAHFADRQTQDRVQFAGLFHHHRAAAGARLLENIQAHLIIGRFERRRYV